MLGCSRGGGGAGDDGVVAGRAAAEAGHGKEARPGFVSGSWMALLERGGWLSSEASVDGE